MKRVSFQIVPADGELHDCLPSDVEGIMGADIPPSDQLPPGVDDAARLWYVRDLSKEGLPPQAPVIVSMGDGDLPEGAEFLAFLPGGGHVWQVPQKGAEKPKLKVYSPGDMHTGPGGPVFGPGSPIVGRG